MKPAAIFAAVILGIAVAVAGVRLKHAKTAPAITVLPVGATLVPFHPWHASGADKGTMECPDCKYTLNPAVQVWVNDDSEQNVLAIAANLDKAVKANNKKKFKAFVVYTNINKQPDQTLRPKIADMAAKHKLNNVALVVVCNWDHKAASDNGINPDPGVKNIVYVYKRQKINARFINLVGDARGLAALDTAVYQVLE